jgi:hypothetical protein
VLAEARSIRISRNSDAKLEKLAVSDDLKRHPPIFAASVRVAPLLIAAKANDRPAAIL